ncbi:MAG: MarC family protein [Actinobacteria bacterium]|nr:MarC family protein [Actinomycetota bacterium]
MNLKLLLTAFITLVVIIDPVGNSPVYLTLTRKTSPEGQRRFANQAVLAATVVIFAFVFLGKYILDYLGISLESLTAAGGVLLGIVALDMMKGKVDTEAARGANVALVPLGTPLLAGPGAVVASLLLMDRASSLPDRFLVAAGILAALAVVWVALRLSTQLMRLLKEAGVDLLTRIMGILLAAIAVEFIHEAVASWIAKG